MPEWLTIIIFLAALTMGYLAGFAAGSWKADRAPTENAWQNVRFRSIDAKKECELRAISYDHEETMALIARGELDGVEFDAPGNDKEDE
jgi:hypothetical protein